MDKNGRKDFLLAFLLALQATKSGTRRSRLLRAGNARVTMLARTHARVGATAVDGSCAIY